MPEYPLSMPIGGFKESSFGIEFTTGLAESPFTGSQQVQSYQKTEWQAVLTLPPMSRDQARAWQSWAMKLQGRKGTFYLCDPDAKRPKSDELLSLNPENEESQMTLTDEISIGAESINISGAGLGKFTAGDYIQIGDDASRQLVMVSDDTDTFENGERRVNELATETNIATDPETFGLFGDFALIHQITSRAVDIHAVYDVNIRIRTGFIYSNELSHSLDYLVITLPASKDISDYYLTSTDTDLENLTGPLNLVAGGHRGFHLLVSNYNGNNYYIYGTGGNESEWVNIPAGSYDWSIRKNVLDSPILNVSIQPPIKKNFANLTPIIVRNPKGVFRMDANNIEWRADKMSRYGISFSCSEAFGDV